MYYMLYTSSEYDDYSSETNKVCLICLLPQNNYNQIQNIKEFNHIITICDCNPLIHINCFNEWFNTTRSCPICRQLIYINTHIFTNKYMKNIKYFFVFFNFTIIITRFSMIISIINLFCLCIYNYYIIYCIKK